MSLRKIFFQRNIRICYCEKISSRTKLHLKERSTTFLYQLTAPIFFARYPFLWFYGIQIFNLRTLQKKFEFTFRLMCIELLIHFWTRNYSYYNANLNEYVYSNMVFQENQFKNHISSLTKVDNFFNQLTASIFFSRCSFMIYMNV